MHVSISLEGTNHQQIRQGEGIGGEKGGKRMTMAGFFPLAEFL